VTPTVSIQVSLPVTFVQGELVISPSSTLMKVPKPSPRSPVALG
jgi:hypothetical protein